MSKIKSSFFCKNCGYENPKWLGKCPSCNQWNTFIEEVIQKGNDTSSFEEWNDYHPHPKVKTIALNDVNTTEEKRISCIDEELNRVLGGGIVKGSIVLIAGEENF